MKQIPSRERVKEMFELISPSYDRVNRIITLGCDSVWRKKMAAFLPSRPHLSLLDCATGTGEQVRALLNSRASIRSIVGVDITESMLHLAKEKISSRPDAHKVSWLVANLLNLPFPSASFDGATLSFGIRNVTDVAQALREIRRVLKPQGRLLILEGTVPTMRGIKEAHHLYLSHLLPLLGRCFSRHRDPYLYLKNTILTFPQRETFCALMQEQGFVRVKFHHLLFGSALIYQGDTDG